MTLPHSNTVTLPWPPSKLSGHANGSWKSKSKVVKSHRSEARLQANNAWSDYSGPPGDIHFRVTFYPPDRRSDRINFVNRMKPYFDGIADALGVNDSRFLIPEYMVMEPSKKPRVTVEFLSDWSAK